jgi:repressor LexA
MTIGQRIRGCRKELNLSADDLAEKLGKDRSTIYRYENGDIGNFPTDILEPLAKILQTTPAYLMGWTENSEKLPKNIIPMPCTHQIPVIGTIACGVPILAEQNIDGYEPCPDFVHANFCLHCKGDSMINARINDGDTVFIREQPEVENGEIAAVEILDGSDCEATLKRFYHEGNKVMLSPENPKYTPLIFVGEEINRIKIVGKAVFFVSEIK